MKTERSDCANADATWQALYDARGNLIQITDALGNVNTFSFDRNNRITQETLPLGQSTRYRYDAAGKLTQTTSPNGHTTDLSYDSAGRLTLAKRSQASSSGSTPTLVRTTRYTWDAEDHLTAWTDTDHSRSQSTSAQLSYDAAGRKTSETITYPGISGNPTTAGAGTGSTLGYSLAYSPGGKPTRLTLPDGTALGYAYSAHGELQSVSIPGEGSISVNQYQWTAPSKTTLPGGVTQNRSLDGLLQLQDLQVNTPGQQTLLQVTNTWGKVQDLQAQSRTDTASSTGATPISSTTSRNFAYDDEVRLTRIQTTAPSSDTQTYTLDALGNRIAHSRISGAWTYDANNRLTQRGSGAGATSYQYDNAGNLTQKLEAGVTTYRYDTQNRLIEVALAQAGATEQVIARYGYDPQDRRIWKEQYASKSGEPLFMAQRTLYLYNDQGLLAEATQPFVLDPRLTLTTVDIPPPKVIRSPGPVISGPLPMGAGVSGVSGSSGVGNLTGVSSVSAAPMAISSGVAVATASGVRMSPAPVVVQAASASPGAVGMASGELVPLGPVAPTITTQYGLRPDSPWGTAPLFIQTKNSAGQTSMAYYHHDQLGTPLQATDKAGNIVWAANFDAFGRASITTPQATVDKPTITSNLRLPGQYEDLETGLHYNWHRYYDAEVGRYVTADPIGLRGGINVYNYVGGNPINVTDVLGLNADASGTETAILPSPTRDDGLPHGAGCGDAGTDYWVPDGFGKADFMPACRQHDRCYDTCGNSKEFFDSQFRDSLLKQCDKSGGGRACRWVANRYYGAMTTETSRAAYQRAQEAACSCRK